MFCCGLCCQNTELTKKNIRCSRTCRQSTFTVEKAVELGKQNLIDCIEMMKWNRENSISSFRLSSEMLPHYNNPNTESYEMSLFVDLFETIGKLSIEYDQKITFHPDQFNVLSSNNVDVILNTYRDLKYHADMMNMMSISDRRGVINIHLGGVYGDKECAMRRWMENFDDMDSIVKKYLTIENDEKSYSIEDCLFIAEECNIPVVFDVHHHECYELLHPNDRIISIEESIERSIEIFDNLDKEYLFHISSQRENARIGTHSDYIDKIPIELIEICKTKKIFVDIEAKMKERAIFDLRNKYSFVL